MFDHVRKLLPLIRQTLADAGLTTRDLDGVAYTAGPGLVGALLVGAGVGRALAWAGLAELAVLSLAYFPFRVALVAWPAVLFLAWVLRRSAGETAAEGAV